MPQPLDAANELNLYDYLRILRRRWHWMMLTSLVAVGGATTWSVTQPPNFCATSQVLIADSEAQVAIQGNSNVGVANRDLANELSIATSDTVRTKVIERVGVDPEVEVTGDSDSDILHFRACGPTSADAARFANTWGSTYVAAKQDQASATITSAVAGFEVKLEELRADRTRLRKPLDDLEDQLAAASDESTRAALEVQIQRLTAGLDVELQLLDSQIRTVADNVTVLQLDSALARTGTARVIQEAAPPTNPASGSLARNVGLSLLAGLILGGIVVLTVDNIDQTIKSAEDIVGLPILGVVPRSGREIAEDDLPLATLNHDGTSVAEAYQKIRSAVEFSLLGREIGSLLITSPNPSEGKTTTSCNLAWALSALDHRVVLADVDFRRPRLHEVFGCAPEPGLSDNLLAGAPLNRLALRVDDQRRNMVIIPTGAQPPNPADFVASSPFAALIKQVEMESDLVVLDAPPILPVSDALTIARLVDTVILVAKAGVTTHHSLASAIESLRAVGADVLGVCLVGVSEAPDRYGYGAKDNGRRRRRQGPDAGRDLIDLRGHKGSALAPRSDRSTDQPAAATTREAESAVKAKPNRTGARR